MMFESIPMSTWLMAGFVLFMLVFINEITRRNKYVSLAFYLVLPIVLTIFVWPNTSGSGSTSGYWFAWVKTYSSLSGVLCFMYVRHKKGAVAKWVLLLPAIILAVNILEAIMRDIECMGLNTIENGLTIIGGPWNAINAVAGVISIITISGWMGIVISKKKSQDMIWPDQSIYWVIAYSIWNLSYCLNCISDRAFYAAVLPLIACLIAELFFRKGAWLQHRAQTLALWAMFTLTIPAFASTSQFAVASANNETALLVISILSLVSNLGVLVYEIITIKKHKRNVFKQDVYVNSKFYKDALIDNDLA